MTFYHLIVVLCLVVTRILHISAEGRDGCFRQVSDVVIAIDSSYSIRSWEFKQQLSFLRNLTDSFTIGKNHMQLGVVSFGTKARMEIPLNGFEDKRGFMTAVDKIKHMEGGTHTGEAIRFVSSHMYKEENGGRPWAKRKLLLITDGFATNPKKTLQEASRARKKCVEIFSIGVGEGTKRDELRGIASKPEDDHVFHVDNYLSLASIKNALTDAACDEHRNDGASKSIDTNESFIDCKEKPVDIFFLMDSSNSIWGPDFKKYIGLVRNVTSTYTLGQNAVRVGLIVYTDRPIQVLSLSDTQTKSHLNRVLDHTERIQGGSNTAKAIRYTRKLGFTNRPNSARIMVILTDGQSSDRKMTEIEAKRAHKDGIHIFAIGVGRNTDSQELMAMASDPDDQYVFHVDDFERLSSIRDLLVMKTCDAVKEIAVNDEPAKTSPSCAHQN